MVQRREQAVRLSGASPTTLTGAMHTPVERRAVQRRIQNPDVD
jgi:hypothetical protein